VNFKKMACSSLDVAHLGALFQSLGIQHFLGWHLFGKTHQTCQGDTRPFDFGYFSVVEISKSLKVAVAFSRTSTLRSKAFN